MALPITAGHPPAPASVADMLRGYSIEINPRESKHVDAAAQGRLEPDTLVFLPWIPDTDPTEMVGPAAKLRRAGLVPVPHIAARHVRSSEQLTELVRRLTGEAGADRVLIIGGDRDKPLGPYDSSLAVMQSGILHRAGITRVAIAGFPEGNPNIPGDVLVEALRAKIAFARGSGLEISIVTQFCFEAGPVVQWLSQLRAMGLDVTVRIGLAGPSGLLTLMRYAVRCGVGNSLRVLTEHPSFAKLLVEKGPEPLLHDIGAALASEGGMQGAGVAGFHFFVFGGFNKTADWLESHLAG